MQMNCLTIRNCKLRTGCSERARRLCRRIDSEFAFPKSLSYLVCGEEEEKGSYEKFKEFLGEAKEKYRFVLHAYLLMTNHYHLIIETPEKNLSKILHYLNSSYTTYSNIKRKRSGHLFQGRYKAIEVDKDSYSRELMGSCLTFVHLKSANK
jgi:REP element-mobilizing transposase RayT